MVSLILLQAQLPDKEETPYCRSNVERGLRTSNWEITGLYDPRSSVWNPLIARSVMTFNGNGSILTKIIPGAPSFSVSMCTTFHGAKSAAVT